MTTRSRNDAHAGGSPCIWMEAGVIDFWLCNCSFECDTCPLDQALRGRFSNRANPGHRPPWTPPTVHFHPSHIWLNPAGDGEWTMGLDFHALNTFSDAPTLSLPRPGRRIAENEQLLSLLVDRDALRWRAPMDVIVLERNEAWDSNPEELRRNPYSRGWALLVKLPRQFERSAWLNADAIQATCMAERSALKEMCHTAESLQSEVGPTSADGGVLLSKPDKLLPREQYLAFLRDQWGLLPPGSGF